VDLENDNKYKMVLFVSGGIGVTPCQSVGKQLLHEHRTQGRNLKQLRFVWAVRDHKMVQDMPPLLLDQEPCDDYSTANPDYQRMIERSQTNKSSQSSSVTLVGDGTSSTSDEKIGDTISGKLPARRRPAVVQADIYCTRNLEQTDEEAITALPYNLYNGRPDLEKIFQELKQDAIALGETSIAVIGCGPPSLMQSLQNACRKHSAPVLGCQNNGIFFDMHKEHFEL